MKTSSVLPAPLLLAACIVAAPAMAGHDHDRGSGQRERTKTYFTKARVTTGYNMSKNKVMYDLGGVVGPQGFHYVFAYEPGKPKPSLITEDTDGDTLLATGIDQAFYDALGIDSSAIDPAVVNLPFRDLPVTVDGNTSDPTKAKARLVPLTEDNYKSAFTMSHPSKPITLRDWYRARGYAIVTCKGSREARVSLRFENMVPNGVYAVWAIIGRDMSGDGLRDFFSPWPFGGAPNVFSADDRGSAQFDRTVPFCPNTDPDMMTIEVTFHVDGVTYGAVPSISPVVSNGNSYLSTPTHVSFNVGGLEPAP
jgi:hypothetical protein